MPEGPPEKIDDLKRKVFFDLLSLAGRVFVLVRHSEGVSIGNRGFLAEEKKNGIVLVFNDRMNFRWGDDGIEATLVFGTSPQKCFVPAGDIVAVYSPELKAQFVTADPDRAPATTDDVRQAGENGDKVVAVDFRKKKK